MENPKKPMKFLTKCCAVTNYFKQSITINIYQNTVKEKSTFYLLINMTLIVMFMIHLKKEELHHGTISSFYLTFLGQIEYFLKKNKFQV